MIKGLKLQFEKLGNFKFSSIKKYDSINRIPIAVHFTAEEIIDRTIYCENFCLGNLIELRFEQQDKHILEFHLVEFKTANVRHIKSIMPGKQVEGTFSCLLLDSDSELKTHFPMELLKTDNSLLIQWGEDYSNLSFYSIGEKVSLGVNDFGYLHSVYLNKLSCEELFIFDY